ncbi:tripartite tricarboxylate transporter TctB family protein [Elioraea sp.]|uniref:tripartite tricarboxylate transporter TctB family protein n=1 Tax=Elioraea sp. TaxID=2185103 RepID=UPI003F71EB33
MAERSARPGERLLPWTLLAASAVVVVEGYRLDGLASPSAAGTFPLLAGAVMAGSCAAIALAPRRAAGDALPMLPLRVAAVMALLVALVAAMPVAGFHLAGFAFLAVAIRLVRGHGTLVALLVATLSVAAVHVVFRLAFTVLLPEGTLWR